MLILSMHPQVASSMRNCNFHHVNISGSGCSPLVKLCLIKREVYYLSWHFFFFFALISACLYFWVIVYENGYILTWIFMITFLIWKALKLNCLLVVFQKLPEISKKWLLLDSQNVLVNWLHPVFDVHPKKKIIILHDSSATDFTLRNLLFVTTLIFICQ